jgi:plastocyanin
MKTNTSYMTGLLIVLFIMIFSFSGFSTKWVVTVADFQFTPSSLPNVISGDTIRWVWVSGLHTTTSTSVPAGAMTWDQPIDATNTVYEYPATVTGTYNYYCMHHPTTMIASFTVTSSTPTGVGKNSAGILRIYPNPTSGQITIIIPGSSRSKTDVLIVRDLIGRTIFSNTIIQDQEYNIDLSDYPGGYYFVQLTSDAGTMTRKVILDK